MKKRNIMIFSVVALLTLLVVGGTMAWFTSTPEEVINRFKAGTVIITVNDTFNTETAKNVNPGDEYEKIVSVTNSGTKKAYIRVKLTPEFEGGLDTSVASFPIESEKWIDGEDGWYYYKEIVPGGESTDNIIEKVIFSGNEMGNAYQGKGFTLTVEAQAVQASHYAFRDEWEKPGNALVPAEGVEEWTE